MTARMHLPVASAAVLALSACTVGSDYKRPEVNTGAGDWVADPALPASNGMFIAWWRTLDDPELTRLVESALAQNLSVRQALERVAKARARRSSIKADFYPEVGARGAADIQRQSENANPAIGNVPGLERDQELYEAGFDAAWEIDLFGGTRRGIEATDAQIGAAIADANGVRLTVASEVARTYLDMRGYQAERRVQRSSIVSSKRTLALVRIQFEAGEVARANVVQAQTDLLALEATLPGINTEVRAAALALGVLTGKLPEAEYGLAFEDVDRVTLAPIPVGERASILRRRPDVASAERSLAAETAEIGVAKAELFPKLSISAFGGFRSLAVDDLIGSDSEAFSLIPFLSWRIFDGGRVRADIRLAEAEARRAALAYEEAVTQALGDAETALTRYQLALETVALRQKAIVAASENYRLADIRYRVGDIDLLRLLDAERALRQAEREEAGAHRRASTNLVALYKALGGGWQDPRSATAPSPIASPREG